MYKFKPKDKVYKYNTNTERYETQHKNTLDPKVYTVKSVSSDGVVLHDVPYVLFSQSGEVLNLDPRKCPGVKVQNRVTGSKTYQLWQNAVIVPANVYYDNLETSYDVRDSSDIMQDYEDKVYQF